MTRLLVLSVVVPLFSTLVASCDAFVPHTHEPDASAARADELEPQTRTVFGERVLLFVEFPPLVRGTDARFLAHFTMLDTGLPVRNGRVELQIGATTLVAAAPKRDGLFIPEGAFAEPGLHRARITVTSEELEEVLELGEIQVWTDEAAARAASANASDAGTSDGIGFLMEQQWKVKLLLAQAKPRALAKQLTVPAVTRTPEHAQAVVASPAAGRLLAPPAGRMPRSGDRVEAGQLLGHVEAPLTASELAQIQALELEVDLALLQSSRALLEAQARLRVGERELERVRELGQEGLSTKPRLDEAERSVLVARAEIEASQAASRELERVKSRRSKRSGDEAYGGLRLELRAPLAGTIVSSSKVEGEVVEAGAQLFQILDPSQLWIEGRVSEFDIPALDQVWAASVSFPALPSARIDLTASALAKAYVSPSIEASSRTFALRYEVASPSAELKHGMLARLALATERVNAAVAIPAEAVVSDQGLPTAYVMISGETFERRLLELGLRDGGFVEVLSGLAPGERVATRGAHIVRLAAFAPASFGAGHAH